MQNTSKAILLLSAIALAIIYAPTEQPVTSESEHLENLQNKLNKAVQEENYEEACLLRDKINSYGKA